MRCVFAAFMQLPIRCNFPFSRHPRRCMMENSCPSAFKWAVAIELLVTAFVSSAYYIPGPGDVISYLFTHSQSVSCRFYVHNCHIHCNWSKNKSCTSFAKVIECPVRDATDEWSIFVIVFIPLTLFFLMVAYIVQFFAVCCVRLLNESLLDIVHNGDISRDG